MDRTAFTERVLLVYSAVLTIVLCLTLVRASRAAQKKTSFDEIDVKRINVVEPDGTVRLVISDRTHFPGFIVKGKEYPHERGTAGMLFFDDEGTEDGGLIFGGMKDKDGKVETLGHLSFDQYMGDQVLELEAGEQNGQRYSGIKVIDQPDVPMNLVTDALQLPPDQRQARMLEIFSGKNKFQERIYLGKKQDRAAALELRDAQGRDRIIIKVAADGTPSIEFLDEQGKVIGSLPREAR
jgi:hypothetical protein